MRIYFSGIGGVGIGPLAEIARDAGYDVVGSDPVKSLMTSELEARGIEISHDQSGEFLRSQHSQAPIDWFVYTAALPTDHPELVLARKLGLKTAKRDELLAHIVTEKNLKLIAVAGTHGKTTTTGMMVWALKQLGIPVSYSVGTTLSWGPSGFYDPNSKYFIYECDEFDRNFLHFSPYLSLVTSIDYDHPDTYPTEADYFAAFSQFIAQSSQAIMWKHDAVNVRTPENAWLLGDNEVQDIKLAGAHNRRNATLVAKGLGFLDADDAAEMNIGGDKADQTSRIIASFPGTNRRFEKLADNLYTDYGHHPAEIKATLQMAHELNDHVVLVYQPHQNIRQHEICELYTDGVFQDADEIYWLPTYLSREDPNLEVLTPTQLAKNLSGNSLHIADLNEVLWQNIERAHHNGALVLYMGAGSIDAWVRQRLTK